MTILTEAEIAGIGQELAASNNVSDIDFAHSIESAVIDKIKARGAEVWKMTFTEDGVQDGFRSVHYHGTNAIADYRQIDPTATVTPLYRIED